VVTHHAGSAVVPASRLLRDGRALGDVLSEPIASVLAFAALLALWFTTSVRRRERLSCAVEAYPRRGPPALPPLI
jgi:hypothetical protein